jgi:radical SAM superfamily enzyme YgiQ (UPF0313 family)
MRILLLSTYELGRQPFGLASPAAWLREAGAEVRSLDLSRQALDEEAVRHADLVAFHLPMHTATRLAVPQIRRIRALNPGARLAAFGVYASPNAGYLRALGVDTVLGPEFEADLVALARGAGDEPGRVGSLPRLQFKPPDRTGLPALSRYAALRLPDGERRTAGYTEASRGCKHLCRHCPIVPVYGGRFRAVPVEVVLADIASQVAAGARHITFGDPDFLNGPTHARRIAEALASAHPGVTYDVVVKIEHILRHPDVMRVLRDTGCLFVTSAVESVDDRVLARLEKGHSSADFARTADVMRDLGLPLVPTFVAFTPWTSRETYVELLDAIDGLDLVEQVAPIQLAIRLLIPRGSRLLELEEIRRLVGPFDPASLVFPWCHPDPAVDALQREVWRLAANTARPRPARGAASAGAPPSRRTVFEAVRRLADASSAPPIRACAAHRARAAVPYLDEPWYC